MKLIHNKIYSVTFNKRTAIFKFNKETPSSAVHIYWDSFHKDSWDFWKDRKIKEATLEEQHWLNTCIGRNQFIEKKEALKTFNKEVSLSFDL